MSALALIVLLFTAQLPPCCEAENSPHAPAAEAAQRAPDPMTGYGTIRMDEEPLQVWLDLGYGSVTERYDEEGDSEPLVTYTLPDNALDSTVDRDAETAAITLHLGGLYDVLQVSERSNVQLGAELSLARHTATTDSVSFSVDPSGGGRVAQDRSSGWGPQNLALSAALDAPRYTLRAGYLFDLGPEPERGDSSDYYNSDRGDALQLKATGRYASEIGYRFFGGVDYVLATESSENNELAGSDVLQLRAGIGFSTVPNFEVGAMLLFRDELPSLLYGGGGGSASGVDGFPPSDDRGYLLSAVPYAAYQAADAPFQIRLKLGFQGEYFDYGYSFLGRDEIAPGLGVTVGITYGIL